MKTRKQPAVYILASRKYGTLYIGVTSDLTKRVWQHKNAILGGFTEKYNIHLLVYFEMRTTMKEAIQREKEIKRWKRAWKIHLIEMGNPTWRDLFGNAVE